MKPRHSTLLLLLGACGSAPPPARDTPPLPPALGSLTLVARTAGEDARDLIAHLHPGPLAAGESEIGFYASAEDRAVLFVSRFGSADTAAAQLAMMARLIDLGRGGFGHHAEAAVGGVTLHATLGQGRVHYFFARNGDVVWLAADTPVARAAVAGLLDVPEDSLPGPPDAGG